MPQLAHGMPILQCPPSQCQIQMPLQSAHPDSAYKQVAQTVSAQYPSLAHQFAHPPVPLGSSVPLPTQWDAPMQFIPQSLPPQIGQELPGKPLHKATGWQPQPGKFQPGPVPQQVLVLSNFLQEAWSCQGLLVLVRILTACFGRRLGSWKHSADLSVLVSWSHGVVRAWLCLPAHLFTNSDSEQCPAVGPYVYEHACQSKHECCRMHHLLVRVCACTCLSCMCYCVSSVSKYMPRSAPWFLVRQQWVESLNPTFIAAYPQTQQGHSELHAGQWV